MKNSIAAIIKPDHHFPIRRQPKRPVPITSSIVRSEVSTSTASSAGRSGDVFRVDRHRRAPVLQRPACGRVERCLRQRIRDIEQAVADATSLADFKARVAALGAFGDLTEVQVKSAYKARTPI